MSIAQNVKKKDLRKVKYNQKTKTLDITYPRKYVKTLAGSEWYPNVGLDVNSSVYFSNSKNKGKKIKTDFIVQNKKSLLNHAVIDKGVLHTLFDLDVKDLQKLLKTIKAKKKTLKTGFFVHLNPELSFFIK